LISGFIKGNRAESPTALLFPRLGITSVDKKLLQFVRAAASGESSEAKKALYLLTPRLFFCVLCGVLYMSVESHQLYLTLPNNHGVWAKKDTGTQEVYCCP
jgi:hypothetical protein